MALQRLKEAAEKAKRELSTAQQTESCCPSSRPTPRAKHLNTVLARQKFEEPDRDLIERTMSPAALPGRREAEAPKSTRSSSWAARPACRGQRSVREFFGRSRTASHPGRGRRDRRGDPAGIMQGEVKDLVLLDVTPHTLGIETKAAPSRR